MINTFIHPLSVFPQLLDFGLLAPFIIRVTVGIFILYVGWERRNKEYNWTVIFYAISALSVILGLYTQIGAILAVAVTKFDFWMNKKTNPPTKKDYALYTLVVVVLLSLLVSGPGFLAFDLPL